MHPLSRPLTILLSLALLPVARAEVARVEILRRGDADGAPGIEEIVGRLHFALAPSHPRNRIIADIDLAPTDAAGRVTFSADLRILRPREAGAGEGVVWMEIPNRGGRSGVNRLFARHGFAVVQVGWEFDVPSGAGKLRADVPRARAKGGGPLRGIVRATFTPDKRVDRVTASDLADMPPVDPGGPDSRLIARAAMGYMEGAEVPRERWRLEGQRVTLEGGFEAGRTYEISYLAQDPPVAGLGLAAIRDAVAWLRRDNGAPLRARRVYAFGSSQCGRLLREFLYLGFNADEGGHPVFDGVMAHVAGAGRLDINRRWCTPRSVASFETASYPFADTAQPDPVSGRSDGVLENPRAACVPKIFYLNTAAEYWGAGRVAALTHTTPDGARDIELPDNVRSYFFAGTQHGPAPFPPADSARGAPFSNPVSAAPVVLALRLALHRWVAEGAPPPPSAIPRLADGTLVPVAQVRFPALPGIRSPRAARAGVRLCNPLWPDGAGAGAELPLLVPQVDADGNDIAGIRLPDVAVPLATCTGWIFRAPPTPGVPPELVPLRGSWIPLAPTRDRREALGDPRLSLAERYPSRDAYLGRVSEALRDLAGRGCLLEDDVAAAREQARARWDWVAGR